MATDHFSLLNGGICLDKIIQGGIFPQRDIHTECNISSSITEQKREKCSEETAVNRNTWIQTFYYCKSGF